MLLAQQIRSKRPGVPTATDMGALQRFIEGMKGKGCDFCNPLNFTAQEEWGRIQSVHYVTTGMYTASLAPLTPCDSA